MSLKSQIEDPRSPVGGFLRQTFPSKRNRGLLSEVRRELDGHQAIYRLEEGTPSWVRGLVGHATDYRIRYHFANTPPERMTMAWEGAWAVTRTDDFIHELRKSPSRFPDYMVTPLGRVPDGDEDWRHFCDSETGDSHFTIWSRPNPKPNMSTSLFTAMYGASLEVEGRAKLTFRCVLEFFDLLYRTAETISAHTRKPTVDEEARLARFCLILSVFEAVRRSGKGWPPEFLGGDLPNNVEDLLHTVPSSWAEDAAALAAAFAQRHADWRGMPATLNPKFAGARDVGGADGDIVVGGCLWEIKTTVQKRAEGRWFYQLLGYVLLDYEDEHNIEHVGFLFPRQNSSIRWSLSELTRELSGQPHLSIADLREEFRRRLRSD